MQVTNSPRFEIIGHRGNPGNPLNSLNIENTVESFEDAWERGADGIELDVILSKDKFLFVHHDDTLGRVFIMPGTKEQKLIGEYTSDELESGTELNENLTTNSHKPRAHIAMPHLSDIRIPKDKKLFLELKFLNDSYNKKSSGDEKYLKNIVEETIQFIEEVGLTNQTYVLCFVPEALDRVKELNPKIVTAHNVYQGEASDLQKIKQLQGDYGFDIINPPFEQATKGAIENIHSVGLKTYPWIWKQSPQKEISEVRRLMLDGAEGAITNQVAEALAATFQYHK